MKKKTFMAVILILFVVLLFILTGCGSDNTNTNANSSNTQEPTSTTNTELAQIEVKEKLDIAYAAVQADFLVESATDSSLTFADYCTQEKLQENLTDAVLNSFTWNDNTLEGTLVYNEETYIFTLTSEGEVSVTNYEE